MARLTLSVFGAPHLELDGASVFVQRRKVMALLIYLSVTGEIHTRDQLAALLWPDTDQTNARAALRRTVSELNKIPGLAVAKNGSGSLTLAGSPDFFLDVREFHFQLDTAQIHHHKNNQSCPECLSHLAEAVSLYQADFLSGFAVNDSVNFDDWSCLEAELLRQELICALKQLAVFHQARGDANQAVLYARRWLVIEPTDEDAHRLLMQIFSTQGQRSSALRQYRECAQILATDLGIKPSPETIQVYQQICAQEEETLVRAREKTPPQKTAKSQGLGNLPAPTSSFIGRGLEIENVLKILSHRETRLLTLTGPGGVGKTRLSLEIAYRLQDVFKDGIFFISLAPLQDPQLVASAIADGLGYHESFGKPILDTVKRELQPKQLLLILDNFEHLLSAALLVSDLLRTAPGLKILVTSRAPLQVYGEHLFSVPPLSLPGPQEKHASKHLQEFEGLRLFADRARAVQPHFNLDAENSLIVAEICQRLNGLPLAIELAAKHARKLPPEVMLAQFTGRDDSFPFHLLSNGPRDVPDRHKTMRNAIAWSYQLLDAGEQALFCRFAVFAGGAQLDAIKVICLDRNVLPANQDGYRQVTSADLEDLATLASLQDNGLLTQTVIGGEERFNMLEMIRAYASEQLCLSGEENCIRQRHAEYYLALTKAAFIASNLPYRQAWIRRLELEKENLRAVLEWTLSVNDSPALIPRLREARMCLGQMQLSFSEQRHWCMKALTNLDHIPGSAEEFDSKVLISDLLKSAGACAYFQGEYPDARQFLAQGEAILRTINEKTRLASILIVVAWASLAENDFAGAKAAAEEALVLGRETHALDPIGHALNNLACQAMLKKNYSLSERLYSESLAVFQADRNNIWEAILYMNMGLLVQEQDDQERAIELYRKGLTLSWQLAHHWGIGNCLEKVARSNVARGQLIQGVRFFAAADTALKFTGFVLEPVERPGHELYLAMARDGLDPEIYSAAWSEGLGMPLEQAVAEALQ